VLGGETGVLAVSLGKSSGFLVVVCVGRCIGFGLGFRVGCSGSLVLGLLLSHYYVQFSSGAVYVLSLRWA
jgi:uncharacterized transporter YbjL